MPVEKHSFARSHPENGACASGSCTLDDGRIAQVFSKEIVKRAEGLRVDEQNRSASGGTHAREIFRSAIAGVQKICLDSAGWRCRRPGHGYGVHRKSGR